MVSVTPDTSIACGEEALITTDLLEIKIWGYGPGWVAQFVGTFFQYASILGSIPGQGTYKCQPINMRMDVVCALSLSPFLYLPLPFSLKKIVIMHHDTKYLYILIH